MCLITKDIELKIAAEDMTVYKVLNKDCQSIFYGFNYLLDKLYEISLGLPKPISENKGGFSYYDSIVSSFYKSFDEDDLYLISEGFHSAIPKDRLYAYHEETERYRYLYLYKCTIPKGANYYVDGTGLVVSNKIIINRIV